MLIDKKLASYKPEIKALYKQYLNEDFTGGTCFGIFDEDTLQAAASVRCYGPVWYLRGCVVKPEFRGQSLQRKLIKERLQYLANKKQPIKISVYPHNQHSIDNIVASGFSFEKEKILDNNKLVHIYKYTSTIKSEP